MLSRYQHNNFYQSIHLMHWIVVHPPLISLWNKVQRLQQRHLKHFAPPFQSHICSLFIYKIHLQWLHLSGLLSFVKSHMLLQIAIPRWHKVTLTTIIYFIGNIEREKNAFSRLSSCVLLIVVPEIVCLGWCQITLGSINSSFCSLYFLKLFPKHVLNAHCLHLNVFSPLCYILCVLRLSSENEIKLRWIHFFCF